MDSGQLIVDSDSTRHAERSEASHNDYEILRFTQDDG